MSDGHGGTATGNGQRDDHERQRRAGRRERLDDDGGEHGGDDRRPGQRHRCRRRHAVGRELSRTPAHGTVTINAGGTVTYSPAANYNGPDSFSYTVSDGHGGTATAAVSVTVTNVNNAPVAVNDSASTLEDEAVTIAVLANDTDADGGTLQRCSSALRATARWR